MWMDGYHDFVPGDRDNRTQVVWGYEICRRDIPTYFTPAAIAAIAMWQDYHMFGLAFSGGSAEQPAVYLDIIRELETAVMVRQKAGQHGRK